MSSVPQHKQGGFAVALLVAAVGAFALAMVVGVGYVNAKRMSNAFQDSRAAYMAEVQRKLATWYQVNPSLEADPDFSISASDLFAAAGIRRLYGITLVLSPQLSDGTVTYHKVAIVGPGPTSDTTGAQYGAYSADGVYSSPTGFTTIEFDGRPLQYRRLGDTNKSLERLANGLEQYATARLQSDAGSDGGNDYFLPQSGCGNAGATEMPCTNGEMSSASFFYSSALMGAGIGLIMQNAWGGDITVNNDMAANSSAPPYTMTVTTTTPWNTTLSIKAVQPLY